MAVLRFQLLGAIEASADGTPLALGGPKQKALLAMLLLADQHSVSIDQPTDAVWGDDPPLGATATLRVLVSNLRRILRPGEPDGIRFDGHGYSLRARTRRHRVRPDVSPGGAREPKKVLFPAHSFDDVAGDAARYFLVAVELHRVGGSPLGA